MADSKKLKEQIEDQEAIIKSDMMPDKVKEKAKKIKVDLEKKLKALEVAVKRGSEKVKEEAEKEIKEIEGKKPTTRKRKTTPKAKTTTTKKGEPASKKKTPAPKKKTIEQKFEITVDGKTFTFDNLKDKESCEKALKAVKARRKEQVTQKKAAAVGRKRAATKPVTQKVTDGVVTVTKRIVSSIPKTKIEKQPEEVKKALDDLEKAFGNLFDKLEALLGKKIPKSQRESVFNILTKIEGKVEESEKKTKAKGKVKKEDGGLADSSFQNDWSYLSYMD